MSISHYIQNNNTFYSVYVQARGKTIFRNSRVEKRKKGIKTRLEAEKVEKKLKKQAHEELIRKTLKGFSWETILKEWELYHKSPIGKHDEHYVLDALSSINKWTKSWMHLPLIDIGSHDVEKIFKELQENGRKQSYQIKIKRRISEVFEWAKKNNLTRKDLVNPTSSLEFKRTEEKLPEILRNDEISKFLKEAELQNHPWFHIWFGAVYTGMRTGELQALEVKSLDFKENFIFVHQNYTRANGFGPTKGRYWRCVPMNSILKNFLWKLIQQSDGGFIDPEVPGKRFVFPRQKQWKSGHQAEVIREFCEKIGIPSICFHTLRACFATHLLRAKVPVTDIMSVGGWKELKTMERYIRLSGTDIQGVTDKLSFANTHLPSQSFEAIHSHLRLLPSFDEAIL